MNGSRTMTERTNSHHGWSSHLLIQVSGADACFDSGGSTFVLVKKSRTDGVPQQRNYSINMYGWNPIYSHHILNKPGITRCIPTVLQQQARWLFIGLGRLLCLYKSISRMRQGETHLFSNRSEAPYCTCCMQQYPFWHASAPINFVRWGNHLLQQQQYSATKAYTPVHIYFPVLGPLQHISQLWTHGSS